MVRATLAAALIVLSLPAQAETPTEWIELGARVHGAFGAFIPIGIRIGLDAKERIKADPRGLAVTYYTGEKAPCPCIADGVMLATNASPGQGTLVIAPEKASTRRVLRVEKGVMNAAFITPYLCRVSQAISVA